MNILRQRSPTVPWSNLIWFKEGIPRFSFVSWMTMLARLPTRETYLMGNDSSSVLSLMLLGSRISFSRVLHLPFLYSSLVSLCRMDVLSSSCFPCFSFDYHRPASHSFMPWCSNCGETLDAVHCLYAVERKKPSYLQGIILLCSCSHQRG